MAAPIPQHNRPDGSWCPWSGCTTSQPERLCPDRCQAAVADPADEAAERSTHPNA